jgi:DnaJ-class molecular chaperone
MKKKIKYCKKCKGWGIIWTGKFIGIKNITIKCPICKGKGIIK